MRRKKLSRWKESSESLNALFFFCRRIFPNPLSLKKLHINNIFIYNEKIIRANKRKEYHQLLLFFYRLVLIICIDVIIIMENSLRCKQLNFVPFERIFFYCYSSYLLCRVNRGVILNSIRCLYGIRLVFIQ